MVVSSVSRGEARHPRPAPGIPCCWERGILSTELKGPALLVRVREEG